MKDPKFSANLEAIRPSAFSKCANLESICIMNKLQEIGDEAFYECKCLKEVKTPHSLRVIGKSAFSRCRQLRNLHLSGGLETIESEAFYDCVRLDEVVIPSSVTLFGDGVFELPSVGFALLSRDQSGTKGPSKIKVEGSNVALAIRLCVLYPKITMDIEELLVDFYSIGPIKATELMTSSQEEIQKLRETMDAYVESIIKAPSVDEFSVAKQHGWVQFLANHVQDDSSESDDLIAFLGQADLAGVRVFANAKDRDGRLALKFAKSHIRQVFQERLLFLGRYDLSKGPPIHKSATCVVVKAEDYKMKQYYESVFNQFKSASSGDLNLDSFCKVLQTMVLLSRDLDGHEMKVARQYFARVDVDKSGAVTKEEFVFFCLEELGQTLALKFMRNKDQFRRELEGRGDLDNKYIVDVIRSHDSSDIASGSLTSFIGRYLSYDCDGATEGAFHDPEEYSSKLVMPYGERNLDTIFRSERPDMVTVRKLMKEVGEALAYLHDQGVVHGDLKMLNVVRMNNRLSLIDLDASAKIGLDFVGAKFSSGILPPELVHSFADADQKKNFGDKEQFLQYFQNESDEEGLKRKPLFSSQPKQGYVVRTFVNATMDAEDFDPETGETRRIISIVPREEGLPFHLVKADPSTFGQG